MANKHLKRGHPPGEKHPNSRLSDAQAIAIKNRVAAGEPQVSLAQEFEVSPSTISKIITGRSRPHLPRVPPPKRKAGEHPRAKLTRGVVTLIWKRLQAGEGVRALAREYGVSPSLIHRIKKGTAWKHARRPRPRKRVWES